MKMNSAPAILLASLLGAGCAHHDRNPDRCAPYYETYQGNQQHWPVAASCYITAIGDVVFYHGTPNVPYTVVGHYTNRRLRLPELAVSAHAHGCTAVWLQDAPGNNPRLHEIYLIKTTP